MISDTNSGIYKVMMINGIDKYVSISKKKISCVNNNNGVLQNKKSIQMKMWQ